MKSRRKWRGWTKWKWAITEILQQHPRLRCKVKEHHGNLSKRLLHWDTQKFLVGNIRREERHLTHESCWKTRRGKWGLEINSEFLKLRLRMGSIKEWRLKAGKERDISLVSVEVEQRCYSCCSCYMNIYACTYWHELQYKKDEGRETDFLNNIIQDQGWYIVKKEK